MANESNIADRVNALAADVEGNGMDDNGAWSEYANLGTAAPQSGQGESNAAPKVAPETPAGAARQGDATARTAAPADAAQQARSKNQENTISAGPDEVEHEGKRNGDVTPAVADVKDESKPTVRKPNFDRSGYELPKSVAKLYVAREGVFVDRKSERIHFEDSGKKLSTTSEDRMVIQSMVEVAKAKGWDRLELRGSDNFKREAWLAAELEGIESRGYSPSDEDKAVLQARREEMRIAAGDKEAASDKENSISTESREHSPGTAKPDPDAGSAPQRAVMAAVKQMLAGREESAEVVTKALSAARSSLVDDRAYVGRVLEHNSAPFDHNPDNNLNYYVKLDTAAGEKVVWGIDFARLAGEGRLNVGEDILLHYAGKQPVTVATKEIGPDGRPTGNVVEVTTHRNEWRAMNADNLIARANEPVVEAEATEAAAPAEQAQGIPVTPEFAERMAALREEIAADARKLQARELAEAAERMNDPVYRRAHAREMLIRAGRDPEEFPELDAMPAQATASNEEVAASTEAEKQVDAVPETASSSSSDSVIDPAAEKQTISSPAIAEDATAKEAALRAVLENEMDLRDLPEADRIQHRAQLEATFSQARETGQPIDAPEPVTLDRSVTASSEQTLRAEQSIDDAIAP